MTKHPLNDCGKNRGFNSNLNFGWRYILATCPRNDINHIQNKEPKKDQTEHLLRKAPGNFTWDVIPGANCPYTDTNIEYGEYEGKHTEESLLDD